MPQRFRRGDETRRASPDDENVDISVGIGTGVGTGVGIDMALQRSLTMVTWGHAPMVVKRDIGV